LFVYRSHYSDQTDQSRLKDVLGSPRTLHRQQTIAEIQAAESRTKEPRQPGLTLRSAVAAVIRPVDKVPLISIDVANDGNSNPPGAAHEQGRKGAKTAMGKILGFQAAWRSAGHWPAGGMDYGGRGESSLWLVFPGLKNRGIVEVRRGFALEAEIGPLGIRRVGLGLDWVIDAVALLQMKCELPD
jgi:hypothetical protein